MTCPNCEAENPKCVVCDGKGNIFCSSCDPLEFKEEPCVDCFDAVSEALGVLQ
jgi:hypothetical protein